MKKTTLFTLTLLFSFGFLLKQGLAQDWEHVDTLTGHKKSVLVLRLVLTGKSSQAQVVIKRCASGIQTLERTQTFLQDRNMFIALRLVLTGKSSQAQARTISSDSGT